MKRRAIQAIMAWKASEDRKPIVLKDARRVGKTWLMKESGKSMTLPLVFDFVLRKKLPDVELMIKGLAMNAEGCWRREKIEETELRD